MDSETSDLIKLLPIIGVFVGGLIALISALSARYLGFKLEKKKEDRQLYMEKLERAYIVLYQIRHDYIDLMGKCQMKVNYGQDFSMDKTGIPNSLSEISMLVNLYMPSLESSQKKLKEATEAFGKTLGKVITVKFQTLNHEDKKELNTEIVTKVFQIEEIINSFQKDISKKIQKVYKDQDS